MNINTIDINAKEWFDRINGNSYFAGSIVLNFGQDSEIEFFMEFQYGYGDYYIQKAMEILYDRMLVGSKYTTELKNRGIILRTNMQRNCKKRELMEYNKCIF
jgi:hypothetical protein